MRRRGIREKIIASVLSLAMVLGSITFLPAMEVEAAITGTIDSYPYGQDMGDSTVTLVVEEIATSSYQWQVSADKDGEYTDIDTATSVSYTFTPTDRSWYRCVIDDQSTHAVQLIKGNSADFVSYYGTNWYVSNGEMAYCAMSESQFDVVGWYDGQWIDSAYSNYWKVIGSTSSTPSSTAVKNGSSVGIEALRLNFDASNSREVTVTVTMEDENYSMAVGTDTQLNGQDACPLTAVERNESLSQIQMVAASSLEAAQATDAAMVIKPVTSASYYWIGAYSQSTNGQAYSYNQGNSSYNSYYTFAESGETRVTEVNGIDSALAFSWVNIQGTEVCFAMSLGTVAQTGASLGNSESTSSSITVEVSEGYYYQLVDDEGDSASEWIQPTDGKVTFENLDSETEYTLVAVPVDQYNEGTPDVSNKEELGDVSTNIDTNNTGSSSDGTTTATPIEVEATCTGLTFNNLNTTDYTYTLKGDDISDTAVTSDEMKITGLTPGTTYQLYAAKKNSNIGADPMECTTLSHSYAYDASGAVITETCANCDHSATATLVAPNGSLVYDGTTEFPATITYSDDWAATQEAVITYTRDEASTTDLEEAGEYEASITVNQKTASITYTVEAMAGAITSISDISKTYDGTSVSEPTYDTISTGVATIEYKLETAADATYSTVEPKDAGDYMVRITVAADNNHKEAVATEEFAITAAQSTTTIDTIADTTYENNVTVTAKVELAVEEETPEGAVTFTSGDTTLGTVEVEDGEASYTYVKPTVGDYAVTATFTSSDSNFGDSDDSGSFTVKKATELADLTFPTSTVMTYGETLESSVLTGGSTSYGAFAWESEDAVPGLGTSAHNVTFTPSDTTLENYDIEATTEEIDVETVVLETDAVASIKETANVNGWYKDSITIQAPEGYYISTVQDAATFGTATELTVDTSTAAFEYFLRDKEDGGITGVKSISDIKIDETVPVVAVTGNPTTWQNTDATLQIVVTEANLDSVVVKNSSDKAYEVVENAFVADVNDTYTVTVTDKAGNVTTESVTVTYIDKTAPVVTEVTGNSDEWQNTDVTITVTATDTDGSGNLTYSFDDEVTYSEVNSKTFSSNQEDIIVKVKDQAGNVTTVESFDIVYIDKLAPDAEIEIAPDTWNSFLETITFGIYKAENQLVKITANDADSTVKEIEYYITETAFQTYADIAAHTEWTEYLEEVSITAEEAKKVIVYAKVTDCAGNVSYVSSNGIIFDITSPIITGVVDGGIYNMDREILIDDTNMETITCNEETITSPFALPEEAGEYEIIATDKAGNQTTVSLTRVDNMIFTDNIVVIADPEKSLSEVKLPYNDKGTWAWADGTQTISCEDGASQKVDLTFVWNNDTCEIEKSEITITVITLEQIDEITPTTKNELDNLVNEINQAIDKELATSDTKLQESLISLEETIMEMNGNIKVIPRTPVVSSEIPDDKKIPNVSVVPNGIVVATYENYTEDDYVELSLDVTQLATQSDNLSFNVKPMISINGGEESVISNDDITAPITFKLYLNDSFKGTVANVEHIKSDGTIELYKNLPVQNDEYGKYILMSVSEFSVFNVYELTYKVVVDDSTTEYKVGDIVKLEVPEKEGYEFAKWNSSDVVIEDNTFIMIEKDVVIESVWEEIIQPETETPNTGDNNNIMLWIVVIILSAGALIGIYLFDKKRKK